MSFITYTTMLDDLKKMNGERTSQRARNKWDAFVAEFESWERRRVDPYFDDSIPINPYTLFLDLSHRCYLLGTKYLEAAPKIDSCGYIYNPLRPRSRFAVCLLGVSAECIVDDVPSNPQIIFPEPKGQVVGFFEETICDEPQIIFPEPSQVAGFFEETICDESLAELDLTDYSLIPEGMWTEYVSHFIKSAPVIMPQHCDTSIMSTSDFVNVMRACGMAASGQRKGPKKKGKQKKMPGKRRNQNSDYSTSIVRGPSNMANLMPDTKVMWLEYNNPTTVILTAAASNFALLNLHPNDLFRPVVGTATQYTGLTAMDTFYNYYLVKKWQLNLEFINADAVPKEVFVIPTPQDLTGTVTTPATAQFYVGSRGVPAPKLVSATGGMDRATINYSMNCSRFYGDRAEYETTYNSVSSGSPANFLNCALVAVTTTANMTFGLMVRLRMRAQVKFYQRKAVA